MKILLKLLALASLAAAILPWTYHLSYQIPEDCFQGPDDFIATMITLSIIGAVVALLVVVGALTGIPKPIVLIMGVVALVGNVLAAENLENEHGPLHDIYVEAQAEHFCAGGAR